MSLTNRVVLGALFVLGTSATAADVRDAVTDWRGDRHVAYLAGQRAFHAVERRGALEAPAELPCAVTVGPWGGTIRIAMAGARVLVLAPASGGFCLARSDDGGRTWATESSQAITGHEAVESQRIAARGARVYLTWVDEHGPKTPGDAVAKPLYLAISEDGARSFGTPRKVAADVCPCCVPAIAATERGVHIAYRSSTRNVKEIAVLSSRDGGRSFTTRTVSNDRWTFLGCPARGPSLEAHGDRLTLTWTREKNLLTATSADGGRTWVRR